VIAESFHVDRRANGETNMTQLIVAFVILRTRPKTGTKSGTKLIRNRSLISGSVPEYPGRIFVLVYDNIYAILTQNFLY
jgi:hypothetical protein